MKKSLVIASVVLVVALGCLGLYGWYSGQLYLPVRTARIEFNGHPSPGSRFYRSRGPIAMVVLDEPDAQSKTYAVESGKDGLVIAKFLSESPDDNILQTHNTLFATCVSPMTYVGMDDGYGGTERIHAIPNGFEFTWGSDSVRVTY